MMQNSVLKEVECTSKHRTLAQVDWSRQLSRDVAPFFVAGATPDPRGSMTGAEAPHRHMGTVDMERQIPRDVEPKIDARDYQPKTYTDLHKHCGVDIMRCAGRDKGGGAFSPPKHQAETLLDVNKVPGWRKAKSKHGLLGPPPKVPARGLLPERTSSTPTPLHSAFLPIATSPSMATVESRHTRTLGGLIPKKDERKMMPYPDRPDLDVDFDSISRHSSTPVFTKPKVIKQKLSEQYRDQFVPPTPLPLASHEKPRVVGGFAPQREGTDHSVSSILRRAEASEKRARKLMAAYFEPQNISPLRRQFLYTPTGDTPCLTALGETPVQF